MSAFRRAAYDAGFEPFGLAVGLFFLVGFVLVWALLLGGAW